MTRGSWGFTNRPYPTMTGHVTATRSTSGMQNVFRRAIEANEFMPPPPFTSMDEAVLSDDRLSLSRAYRPEAVNVTIAEAAILQTYPPGFEFAGRKGMQGLQVGNAVPPLLAEAILGALWA